MSVNQNMSDTPNVVIENPTARRVLNHIVGWGLVVLGAVQAADSLSPAFDLSGVTVPAMGVVGFLAGILAVGVTVPNIPKA